MADVKKKDFIEKSILRHGDKYIYDKVEYINVTTKVLIGCRVEGHGYFEQTPHNHKQGKGCPRCSGHKKSNTIEITEQFIKIHEDRYLYDRVDYVNCNTKVWIGCKVEGHGYFEQEPRAHLGGQGCPKCSGRIVSDKNSIRSIRPDLTIYLKNEEDADNYSHSSGKRIDLICPYCKMENKSVKIDRLSNQGFSCKYCSDGISIPEKFCINLLKDMKIIFDRQKRFSWSQNKQYDFYIPLLNMIIETHGEQHYTGWNNSKEDLCNQIENDKLKYNLAVNNNIKNYIIIDCRKTNFEWLKENFIKSLNIFFKFDNVNFDQIYNNCKNSIAVEIWEYWNKNLENKTIKDMSKYLKLNTGTIRKYLKIGTKLGFCNYDSLLERNKSYILNSVSVKQYNKNGEFLKTWNSVREIKEALGLNENGIRMCINGKLKSSGGFVWRKCEGEIYDYN